MDKQEIKELVDNLAAVMGIDSPKIRYGNNMCYSRNTITINKNYLNDDKYLIGSIAHEMVHCMNKDKYKIKSYCFENLIHEVRADINGYYYLHLIDATYSKEDYLCFIKTIQKDHIATNFSDKKCLKYGYFPCDVRIELVNNYDKFTNDMIETLQQKYDDMKRKNL